MNKLYSLPDNLRQDIADIAERMIASTSTFPCAEDEVHERELKRRLDLLKKNMEHFVLLALHGSGITEVEFSETKETSGNKVVAYRGRNGYEHHVVPTNARTRIVRRVSANRRDKDNE